jgi:hypothetical protein
MTRDLPGLAERRRVPGERPLKPSDDVTDSRDADELVDLLGPLGEHDCFDAANLTERLQE